MATDISVRISRNPYQGYEARFWWNGMLNRYSFELRTDLACRLVDDCLPQHVIDWVMDSLDSCEWGEQPVFPLGVVYVGEAVCDMAIDDPVYANVRPAEVSSPFWDWFAATLRVGSVAAPWVLLMIACRFAWGLAVAWGWV